MKLTDQQKREYWQGIFVAIQLRIIKEVVDYLPPDQKTVFVEKMKSVQEEPEKYVGFLLDLTKDKKVKQLMSQCVEMEFEQVEKDFLKVASAEQKLQLYK